MTTILLLLTALCPPDAATCQPLVTVIPHQSPAYAGKPATFTAGLVYANWDIHGYPNSSFSNGTLTVTVEGNTYNLTPPTGIPLMGRTNCAPTNLLAVRFTNTFCASGLYSMTINYRNEQGPFGLVTATYTRYVRVECQSPLFITKQGDNVLVRWYGYGRYSLEASEDLRAWQEVGVVGTGDECEDLSMVVPSGTGARFFRYRRLQ